MKALRKLALVGVAFPALWVNVFASTLNGEYSISNSITNQGLNTYSFDYYVTNVNQSLISGMQPVGLDGFSVAIPTTAVITGITNPPVDSDIWPGPPSYWGNTIQTISGQRFIVWWGYEWDSVYLMGTTAHFSFTAENVDVGTVGADVTTFWNGNPVGYPAYLAANGAYYATYTTQLLGPVATTLVTEPSTFLLLGVGLSVASYLTRRKKALFRSVWNGASA